TNPTVTCTAHSGATCTVSAVSPGTPNSQTLSCSFGNIASGESCTVTVDSATQVDQPGDCVASPGLVNTACAVADNAGQVCNDASQSCGKVCPFANPELPGLGFCTILNDGGKVAITGPAGEIQGNICIGDSGKLSMSGSNFVTNAGQVLLEAGASCSGCTAQRVQGGVVQPADLSAEIAACQDARASNTPVSLGGSGSECTETVAKLQSLAVNGVITRSGDNKICLTADQQVKGLKLAGDASTTYTFIVQGKFKFQDAKLETVAPVEPKDVLWLF